MQQVYVHSADAMLHQTADLPHSGVWRYDLVDGTFLHCIGTWSAATMRAHVARAAAAAPSSRIVALPTVASGTTVATQTQTSVAAHVLAHLKTTAAPPMKTKDVLDAVFALTADSMFSSDHAA